MNVLTAFGFHILNEASYGFMSFKQVLGEAANLEKAFVILGVRLRTFDFRPR
ncbi:hypothetical protein SOVF_129700 [Spinacia oleracea]|nr:hypothetical protein SOVF_129700 [Spinacia oleracea]